MLEQPPPRERSSPRHAKASPLGNLLLFGFGLVVAWLILELGIGTWEDRLERNAAMALGVSPDDQEVDQTVGAPWTADGSSSLHVRAADPDAVFELRPNARSQMLGHPVLTNHLGMRSEETTDAPRAGVVRVLALGDSVTFGVGLSGSEAWPAVLGRLLDTAHPGGCGVEVLNAGVGGYNTVQVAAAMRRRVPEVRPDLILYAAVANDDQVGADGGLWRHFTRSRSRVFDFVSLRWRAYRARHSAEGPIETGLDAMAALDRTTPAELLVVPFPSGRDGDWPPRITALATARALPVLQIIDSLDVAPPSQVFRDDVHPTAFGAALAAEGLAIQLVPRVEALCPAVRARQP